MADLWRLTATETAEGIRHGDFSSEEVVTDLLERIQRLDPSLHAWETLDPDGALAEAKRADAQRSAGGTLPPLLGVPYGIKDIFYTRGVRTTAGSPIFLDFVPDHDAGAVERLHAAGAVSLGKTVTTPFAYVDPAPTLNPWSADHTPGGSSSGSGAAVATRMVPAALGSQTGGSVLRPAAYCGVVGLKPSFGRISRYGVFPAAWSLDTMGVLTNSVEDAALFLGAMAGHDPRDPYSSEEPVPNYLTPLKRTLPRKPRLGMLRDFLDRASPASRAQVEHVAQRLEKAGAKVRESALPLDLDVALASHHLTMQSEIASAHAFQHQRYPDLYPTKLRSYVETGLLLPAGAYIHAQRIRRRLRAGVDALLEEVDALILPSVSDQAPDPSTTGDPTFQALFTLLGLPAIALPTGLSGDGLPLSTQLVGRRFGESQLLETAAFVERTVGFIPPPPEPGAA